MRKEAHYLLHLWCDGEQAWRASLTELHSRESHKFATLKALYAFLGKRTNRKFQEGSRSPSEEE